MSVKKDKLLGIIDIGSHAVRLYIGEVLRKGKIQVLEHLWMPIAIGKDIFAKNMIQNATIVELIKSLKNFQTVCNSYKVEKIKAVATNSLQEAVNSDILIDRIRSAVGIKVEIIDPVEETEIIYHYLSKSFKKNIDFNTKNIVIFIVGAGSSKIIFLRKGKIVFSETFHIGTLRMQQVYSLHHDSFNLFIKNETYKLNSLLDTYQDGEGIDKLIAINDDLLNIIRTLDINKKAKNLLYRLPKKSFIDLYKEIHSLSPKKMMSQFKLSDSLIQTSLIAFILVGKFFQLTNAKRILFPDISLSSALLWRFSLAKSYDKLPLSDENYKNIISAVLELAKKYKTDINHAKRVRKIAVSLFDQLKNEYGFSEKERLYLEVSSLLHDIGRYISFKSHHKHSAVLIASSEVLGLNKNEMSIIAQITRYHRRALPKQTHNGFIKLPEKSRIIVAHMASLLRIADGMDQTFTFIVEKIKVKVTEDTLYLLVKIKDNNYKHFDLFKMQVKNKSDFFERTFGLNINIDKLLE